MPKMTAELRVYIRTQINAIARECLDEERVLFCQRCFEPYDKGKAKECSCRRGHQSKGIRKVASPVAV